MSKITKSFRLEETTVKTLTDLQQFYNDHMQEFSVKKATLTDVIELLIQKEKEQLKKGGYNI